MLLIMFFQLCEGVFGEVEEEEKAIQTQPLVFIIEVAHPGFFSLALLLVAAGSHFSLVDVCADDAEHKHIFFWPSKLS
jgi:hypothetical protein